MRRGYGAFKYNTQLEKVKKMRQLIMQSKVFTKLKNYSELQKRKQGIMFQKAEL